MFNSFRLLKTRGGALQCKLKYARTFRCSGDFAMLRNK